MYSTKSDSPTTTSALQIQILSGVYNGIGRSSGSLIGGNLQAVFGTAETFKFGAIANVVAASILLIQGTGKKRTAEGKKDK